MENQKAYFIGSLLPIVFAVLVAYNLLSFEQYVSLILAFIVIGGMAMAIQSGTNNRIKSDNEEQLQDRLDQIEFALRDLKR